MTQLGEHRWQRVKPLPDPLETRNSASFPHHACGRAADPLCSRPGMHEASIIEAVLERAIEETRKAGASSVERIRLRVGVLAGVVPEALHFAFEALRQGTPAARASLEVESAPALFRCLDCRHSLESRQLDFTCPACGGPLVVDSGGHQLELIQLEVT